MSKERLCSAGRGRRGATAASALLAVMATVLAAVALGAVRPGPLGLSANGSVPPSHASPPGEEGRTLAPLHLAPLSASQPTSLTIQAIDVHAPLHQLGLARDGSIEVPRASRYDEPGWFDGSPTPGELGPSVIVGHLDGKGGVPSVFHRLGSLEPGQSIRVRRADSSTVTFEVYRVERYAKRAFPTEAVYGNTSGPELRLITCAGGFDEATHRYLDNTVVYAKLAGVRGATSPGGGH